MNLNNIKKIYMIGIKGVGMTMLAQYLAAKGIEIIGSDVPEQFITAEILQSAGIKVIQSFSTANLPADADLIVYSTAYNAERNVEVAAALAGKIKTLTYAEALGTIFNGQYGIAVAGTHGKTTTTAWLGYVLWKSNYQPSVMVGSPVPQFGGASLVGRSDYLVIEADEYQNKLQYFQPKAVILNNIDYDHPDFFPTRESYNNVFLEFIKKIPNKGFLIANYDDPIIRREARANCRGRVVSYAIDESADYVAYNIRAEAGRQFFKVKLGINDSEGEAENYKLSDSDLGDFSIQLAGRHNISNALAVIAASIELGIGLTDIRKYLEEFTGTSRRLEVMGEFRGAIIIDDYGHHPTEIQATLAGVRQKYADFLKKNKGKLRVVFHPHTFTRTKALLDNFAKSFKMADEVIILDIYGSAREVQGGVHSRDLVEAIKQYNNSQAENIGGIKDGDDAEKQKISYIPTKEECEAYLRENIERGDIALLIGAGDVYKIGVHLLADK